MQETVEKIAIPVMIFFLFYYFLNFSAFITTDLSFILETFV